MRNELYPRRQARYIIGDELAKVLASGVRIERDSTFGVSVPELEATSQHLLKEDLDEVEDTMQAEVSLPKKESGVQTLPVSSLPPLF